MENRYIYHYCAVEGNAQLAEIAQLTFRIKTQSDLNKLKELVTDEDFKPKAIISISYLGREFDEDAQ